MINNPYEYYITGSSNSLGKSYIIPQQELIVYATQSYSGSIDFGYYKEDNIEFSIYNTNKNNLYWGYAQTESVVTTYSRSYYDLNNSLITYSYTTNVKNYAILNGQYQLSGNLPNIILDPIYDLNNAGFSNNGSYFISYNFLRDIVGNSELTNSLIIRQISSTRTELQVSPSVLRTTEDSNYQKLNQQYYAFGNNIPYIKNIVDDIENNITNPDFKSIYYSLTSSIDPILLNQLKIDLSFQNDQAVIGFISGSYPNVSTPFEQYLFSVYDTPMSFGNINTLHYTYSSVVLTRALQLIRTNNNQLPLTNFNSYLNFFLSIFQKILDIDNVQYEYNQNYGKELKYLMNFGNNNLLPILNWMFSSTGQNDPINQQILLIKLAEPLPISYQTNDSFWISNQQYTSMFQSVFVSSLSTSSAIPLSGPDFSKKTSAIIGKQYNYNDIVNQNTIVNGYINNINRLKNLNVDYSDLNNFIHFSSAETRIDNFLNKLNQINNLTESINYESSYSDTYSQINSQNYESSLNEIIQTFDDYENFLYNNQQYIEIHQSSASLYDKDNLDSLINNMPDWIYSNSNNEDYILFIKMIGQFFDQLWLYINHFPTLEYVNNQYSNIDLEILSTMLESFGWDYNLGTDLQSLSLFITGKDNNGNNIQNTGKSRSLEITKRIINNLPYLLKTKGTEECIRALFKCYGIPNHIFDIREYGGIEYASNLENDSYYIFEDINYMLQFKNNNEYIKTPWAPNIQTVEFKFSINSQNIDENLQNMLLFVNYNNFTESLTNWALGVIRPNYNSEQGQLYFTVNDGNENYITLFLEEIPVFNGEIYSVLLRKNNLPSIYNSVLQPNCAFFDATEVPTEYDLKIYQYLDNGVSFSSTGSIIFSGSYNSSFQDPNSSVVIGNSPLFVESESINYFQGAINNIRYWSQEISDDRFDSHVRFQGAYDVDDATTIANTLLMRLDFEIPTDLHISQSVSLKNDAVYQYLLTQSGQPITSCNNDSITANNFRDTGYYSQSFYYRDFDCPGFYPTSSYVSGTFPYQFLEFDVTENVKLPNYGANKFRSNKIRIETLDLLSPLSHKSRSTVSSRDREPADSNKLAIVFTPIDQLNLDIIKFFGDFEFGNYIGDPAELSARTYYELDIYKKFYYNEGYNNINYQQFINTFSSFVDKSIFDHIKKLVPARSKLITGILIEPTILERPKVPVLNPDVYVLGYTSSINLLPSNNSTLIPVITCSLQSLQPMSGYVQRYFGELEDGGFGILALNGFDRVNTKDVGPYNNYQSYRVEVKTQVKKQIQYDELNYGNILYPSQKTQRLNLIQIPYSSGSNATSSNIIHTPSSSELNGYFTNHYRHRRKLFEKYAVQTSMTTVNEQGVLDGSDPFTSTLTNNPSIIVNNENGSNILNS